MYDVWTSYEIRTQFGQTHWKEETIWKNVISNGKLGLEWFI
jgi:hypothetical protein